MLLPMKDIALFDLAFDLWWKDRSFLFKLFHRRKNVYSYIMKEYSD